MNMSDFEPSESPVEPEAQVSEEASYAAQHIDSPDPSELGFRILLSGELEHQADFHQGLMLFDQGFFESNLRLEDWLQEYKYDNSLVGRKETEAFLSDDHDGDKALDGLMYQLIDATGSIVASASVTKEDELAIISNNFTVHYHQRSGYMRYIFEQIEQDLGPEIEKLVVHAVDGEATGPFYEKVGFTATGDHDFEKTIPKK